MASKAKTIAAKARKPKGGGWDPSVGQIGEGPKGGKGEAAAFGGPSYGVPGQKKGADKATNQAGAKGYIPSEIQPFVGDPQRFWKQSLRGTQPTRRLMDIRGTDIATGLTAEREAAQKELSQQYDPTTGKPIIDYHEEAAPVMSDYEKQLQGELGQGFTPSERAAYYGAQHDPLMARQAQAMSDEGERSAAAGIDPRSGVAAGRAAGIQAQTAAGLAAAGRDTELANLKRKEDIEQQAANMSGLEESKRASETQSELGRLGTIEAGLGQQSGLGENARQFDYTLAEGQRQAEQRRQDIAKAAREMQPTTLEKVSSGISGFLGGLTGGGGGGGGGGMGI